MGDCLLLAIDQSESAHAAVDFTTALATRHRSTVRVFHVHELCRSPRVPPLETLADARCLVDEAVTSVRLASVGAEGGVSSARSERVADRIVEESSQWPCDAIVLGSQRLRGFSRLAGCGVREREVRCSPLPVIVTPTVLHGVRRVRVESRVGPPATPSAGFSTSVRRRTAGRCRVGAAPGRPSTSPRSWSRASTSRGRPRARSHRRPSGPSPCSRRT
jgi:nucleotide-binding universal stress UspA family protein